MCVYVCVCMLTRSHECLWRPEDNLGWHSSGIISLFLLRQGLSQAWNWSPRLAGEWTPLFLSPPHQIISIYLHAWLLYVDSGAHTQVLMLVQQIFTHWTTSPSPQWPLADYWIPNNLIFLRSSFMFITESIVILGIESALLLILQPSVNPPLSLVTL